MKRLSEHARSRIVVAGLLLGSFLPAVHAAGADRETVAPAFTYQVPNAKNQAITAMTVTYPPGAKTPAHRHGNSFVIGYVLEGAIRSKLDDGEEKVYRVGESWTEAPGAHHVVSGNASTTESAKILAIFVAYSKQKDLVVMDDDKSGK